MNIKRKIDTLLAKSNGMQLVWLLGVSAICLIIAFFIAYFVFDDGKLVWQNVVAVFLDPGCFGGPGDHDIFRLIIALLSVFLFSALLVSVFTNLFDNIRDAAQSGERRYKLSGHVLILGAGKRLAGILAALNNSGKTAVVMSKEKPDVELPFIFYKGQRDSYKDLMTLCADMADMIYIIGEDDEAEHDDKSLVAWNYLTQICANATKNILCFLTLDSFNATEVFQYSKIKPKSNLLLVDTVNEYEYMAEQLLINENASFLPVIKSGSNKQANIIIVGTGPLAQAIAYTAAHLCHYHNFTEKGIKTRITFIGGDMQRWKRHLETSRPTLFKMSKSCFLSSEGAKCDFLPEGDDFLDIEWQFVESEANGYVARKYMEEVAGETTRVIICEKSATQAQTIALHLPKLVYKTCKIAVYMPQNSSVLDRANVTGMYGTIIQFGQIDEAASDPLFLLRSQRGKRVNFIYHKKYSDMPCGSADEAWHKISEADKYSSIYCGNAMVLRKLCYDFSGDKTPIYEAEHRRWLMSELLMGFEPGEKTDKKRFIHADIVPYDKLTETEQIKDADLIDQIDYILHGD